MSLFPQSANVAIKTYGEYILSKYLKDRDHSK